VPAPSTLRIAEGLPVRSWDTGAELTTPTGAAIIRTAASEFGSIPAMKITAVGYGAGGRDLERIPNIMRLVVGETSDREFDEVAILETNIDDMNPQFFSHLYEDLFSAGALDVWVTDVMMKKGRPGFLLSVLAERTGANRLAELVLAGTTTSGVRLTTAEESGPRFVPEYEDCLRVSRAEGVSIERVMEEAKHAARKTWKDTP
jgi:uncharacterized protein (DUF111 family)